MTKGKAEGLIGQTCAIIGRVDTIVLDGDSYRVRLVLPGGIIQEFGPEVFEYCELDANSEPEEVKYQRDLLLMLILDVDEFGPEAFKRAVDKIGNIPREIAERHPA